jgi:hypothetical protein
MGWPDLSTLSQLVTIVGVPIGVLTLIYAALQYKQSQEHLRADLIRKRKDSAEKSAEYFLGRRQRTKSNEPLTRICTLLDQESSAGTVENQQLEKQLAEVPFEDKRTFLGLFEEVAVLVNSGFIPVEIAHYMFGYYALLCDQSLGFWLGDMAPSKTSSYWIVFFDFADRMREVQGGFLSAVSPDTAGPDGPEKYVHERLVFWPSQGDAIAK